jgi:hypothetical protein
MEKQKTTIEKLFLLSIALLGWFSLIMQLVIIVQNRVLSLLATLNNYISFFTILTNTLVAVTATVILLKPASKLGLFLSKSTTLTATTIYILVVGAVYNLILRFIWEPKGMQMAVDELLHTIIPVLFLIYWFAFVRKDELQWKNVFPWMLYPFIYFIYIIVRGAICGRYPYPFVDVTVLGYPAVFTNSAILTVAFGVLSLLFIGLGKLLSRKK